MVSIVVVMIFVMFFCYNNIVLVIIEIVGFIFILVVYGCIYKVVKYY